MVGVVPLEWAPCRVPASPVALPGAPPGRLRRPAPAVCGAWGPPRACSRVASRVISNLSSCRQLFNTSQSLPMVNGHRCRTPLAAHALTKACAAIWLQKDLPQPCNIVTLPTAVPPGLTWEALGEAQTACGWEAPSSPACTARCDAADACQVSGCMEGPAESGATSLGLCQSQVCPTFQADAAATALRMLEPA